jgi:hypothetical protein
MLVDPLVRAVVRPGAASSPSSCSRTWTWTPSPRPSRPGWSGTATSRPCCCWPAPGTATWREAAEQHAPEGLVVYLEASKDGAVDVARDLWRLRPAGWFDRAHAVLIARTSAPDATGFSQVDAVRSVLGDLGLPVVLDVDCGHVPPHLALVNGARAEVTVDGDRQEIVQRLVCALRAGRQVSPIACTRRSAGPGSAVPAPSR